MTDITVDLDVLQAALSEPDPTGEPEQEYDRQTRRLNARKQLRAQVGQS